MKIKVLLHVSGEIGTKGKNRIIFERKLAANIRKKIKRVKIKRTFGSFLLEIEKKDKSKLKTIPGIAWIAEVEESERDLKKLYKKVEAYLKSKKISQFDLEVRRPYKQIPKTSQEIRQELIKFLIKKNFRFKPKTKKIFIELNKNWWLIFSEKEKGLGGLPSSTSGKVIALLSGGIDSASASFLAMKKGLEVVFLHFHNYPSNTYKAIDEKIIELVKKLNSFQVSSKIYIIGFDKAQKEIIKFIKPKYRMLIYRWFMFKIAELLALKEKAQAIVSGDSLGQVASQTLTNLSLIINSIKLPILMPLVGFTKQETIELAKSIGTYEISIKPYTDCCSFLVAKHPATKLKFIRFKKLLELLPTEKIIEESLKNIRTEIIEN